MRNLCTWTAHIGMRGKLSSTGSWAALTTPGPVSAAFVPAAVAVRGVVHHKVVLPAIVVRRVAAAADPILGLRFQCRQDHRNLRCRTTTCVTMWALGQKRHQYTLV